MSPAVRVVFWSVVTGVSLGFLVLESYYSEREYLALAKVRLLEGDFDGASQGFSLLADSFWVSEDALAGWDMSSILGGGISSTLHSTAASIDPNGFPYRLLLFQALMGGKYESCRDLAVFLKGREVWAPLFRAAALLELGNEIGGEVLFGDLENCWLGERLRRTWQWLEEGPELVVYDRRGTALGVLRDQGGFHATESYNLIPPEFVSQVKRSGGVHGCRLSLDHELSRIASVALEGYRGSIVILSLRTGDVLVAVSDKKTIEKEGTAAFRQLREPASISKLITTTAALRAGVDPDASVSKMSCRGAERYRGGILYCSYRAGPLEGLDHAMAISCNIAFANLGVMVGREGMVNELSRYGFDFKAALGLTYGEILQKEGNQLQLADLSIGLEATSITPIHAALIAAVYGNQGVMPKPRLLAAEDGWLGLSPAPFYPNQGKKVIDAAWIPELLESMKAVTNGGTASGISVPSFEVAMKTGTGRNKNLGFHTNYIGIGPMPKPKIAFCIRVTNQPTSGRVRRATLRVGRRLFDAVASSSYLLTDPL